MANPIPTEIFALKFSPGRPAPTLLPLQVQSGEDLAFIRAQGSPAAYVVASKDLGRLAFLKEHVQLRHPKHDAKSLTAHLLNTGNPDDPRVPLINGHYKSASQLRRSIRTFLRHAVTRNANQIYFVGATPELFDQLRARQVEKSKRSSATTRGIERGDVPWAKPISEKESSRRLLELLPDIEIPPSLVAHYVGSSLEVQVVRRLILAAAASDLPVLILGESGTGKELVAKAIHQFSRRAGRFEPVNCSTFPPDLLESELFGHAAGAFTGARKDRTGLWEAARDGTLFLDEIADLRLEHQAKLLRVLEEKRIRRLGDNKGIDVDARIVCASNRDLLAMVRAGRFREDLYYRIRGLVISTPSLRSHLNDIEDVAQVLWTRITADRKSVLPRATVKALRQHTWPGNVRELKTVLEAMHNLFGKTGLTVEKLQLAASYRGGSLSSSSADTADDRQLAYRSECLRHLLRADEVIRACEVSARPLAEQSNGMNNRSRSALRETLQHRLSELELLTLRPLLFHSEETYNAVSDFKTSLQALFTRLETKPARATEFWRTELTASLKHVVSSLFAEVQRLLK